MRFIKNYEWLAPSVIFTVMLVLVRICHAHNHSMSFVPWNMALAIVPLYLSFKLDKIKNKALMYLCALGWLLFFPNAMYMVTDLFHLRERADAPEWFDLLILFSSALNGLVMGLLSLSHVEKWLRKIVKAKYITLVIFTLFILCGYGIYLGRYERWNSWDIVTQPLDLIQDIAYNLRHPFRGRETWALSVLFGVWLFLLYKYFKRFTVRFR